MPAKIAVTDFSKKSASIPPIAYSDFLQLIPQSPFPRSVDSNRDEKEIPKI
jgi:hypothetical protein